MDQRVSLNKTTPAHLQEPVVVETQNWMPPVAPLAMPKQVLELQTHRPALADVARMLFLRRKT